MIRKIMQPNQGFGLVPTLIGLSLASVGLLGITTMLQNSMKLARTAGTVSELSNLEFELQFLLRSETTCGHNLISLTFETGDISSVTIPLQRLELPNGLVIAEVGVPNNNYLITQMDIRHLVDVGQGAYTAKMHIDAEKQGQYLGSKLVQKEVSIIFKTNEDAGVAEIIGCESQSDIPDDVIMETSCKGMGGVYIPSAEPKCQKPLYRFGGMYQVDDCGTNNVNNPLTSALSCPASFTSNLVWRVTAPESGCGANVYLCHKPVDYENPDENHFAFGGGWQKRDSTPPVVNNPITGGPNCPGGYTTAGYARVKFPEAPQNGSNPFFCYKSASSMNEDEYYLGGMFAIDSCGGNNVSNPLTGLNNCPQEYIARKIGRARGPESGCGVDLMACIRRKNP